jgi:phosphonate transport system substrate-binding protein
MVVIPTEDVLEQQQHLQPLVTYLEGCIGSKIDLTIAEDYTAAVLALKYDHADIAWIGPFAYIIASREADVEAIAGGIRKDTGTTTYNSIIITRSDTGIHTIDDLKGRTFAFVDPASTSGYLVPLAMFSEHNISPEKYFSNVMFAGSHTATELAVYNGTVDAAADSMPSYEIMVQNSSIDPHKMSIIWVSEDIPPSPIVVQKRLGIDTITTIQKCLLQSNVEVISFEGAISGFAAISDGDYNFIRDIARTLGLDK